MRARSPLYLSAALTVLCANRVMAQSTVAPQDLRSFSPPADGLGGLQSSRPKVLDPGSYQLGAWFSYANQVLVYESTRGSKVTTPLRHQYSVDYTAALGLHRGLDLGFGLPTVLYQTGDSSGPLDPDPLPRSAYGDLRLDLKSEIVDAETTAGFGLGTLSRITFPTATGGSFASHEGLTSEFRVLVEQTQGSIGVVANLGARFRESVQALDERLGYDLPWALALSYALFPGSGNVPPTLSAGAELHGRLGLAPTFAAEVASPALFGLWLRSQHGAWCAALAGEGALNHALGGPRLRLALLVGFATDAHPR